MAQPAPSPWYGLHRLHIKDAAHACMIGIWGEWLIRILKYPPSSRSIGVPVTRFLVDKTAGSAIMSG
ncbi:MAG: hypothetical protein OEV80_05170 [candidate division Zixibacteria bacterium]|nr:hypothetical protein [candidate division Zixibacteria bacterium]